MIRNENQRNRDILVESNKKLWCHKGTSCVSIRILTHPNTSLLNHSGSTFSGSMFSWVSLCVVFSGNKNTTVKTFVQAR